MMEEKVLDHGFVKLIETWGSDERIIEAARMSTQKGFEGWGPTCSHCSERLTDVNEHGFGTCSVHGTTEGQGHGDEKLLRYLYENRHHTPFEMAGTTFEIQAPIFVFREWHRHRTQSYNEMSARYSPLPDVNYVPSIERLMRNAAGSNRQANRAAGAHELTVEGAGAFQRILARQYADAEDAYQVALKNGVPKELARVVLPVGRYSRMRASANLRNWMGFLALRDDKAAQWEIQQFAGVVRDMLTDRFPRTMSLFKEGRG